MKVYYNDTDKFVCEWLFQLMKEGCIPNGEIDSRSIVEVTRGEIRGFDQCHFFAGIGGWAYALRLAEWKGPVWTGSCPCQPFSSAGKRKGVADERHLWPEFRRLISECSPSVVFGEQVESKDGRLWFSGVRSDLEKLDYAVGAADLCAAGVGSPNRRQRLYWVGYSTGSGWQGRVQEPHEVRIRSKQSSRLGNSYGSRLQGRNERPDEHADQQSPWETSELIYCTDGKSRRVERGSFPLANGVPSRVGRLRGYGNAINPYVAAEFIAAYMEII